MRKLFAFITTSLLLATCAADIRVAHSPTATGRWMHSTGGHFTYSVDSSSPFSTFDFRGPFQPYSLEGDLINWFTKFLGQELYGPCTAIPAGPPGQGLGLTNPAGVNALSFGEDAWWPAYPMMVTFSVDRSAVGLPTMSLRCPIPGGYNPSDVYNEAANNEAAGDMFVSWVYMGTGMAHIPPAYMSVKTLGWNVQWMDEDGNPIGGFSIPFGCANLTVSDDIDAFEETHPAQRDPNLTGTPGATTVHLPFWGGGTLQLTAGGPVFFSLDPTSAAANGVSPGDILASANGTWWVYATAAQLGLSQNDDIDALALSISPYLISPNVTFSPPIHSILYSVSPSSPIVGTTCPFAGLTIGPGDILTSGSAFGISQPMIFIPASGLGLASLPHLDWELESPIPFDSIPRNFTDEYTFELSTDAYILKGAKDWKESIAPMIDDILPIIEAAAAERLNEVLYYTTESLTPELWIDNSHLDPDNGDHVFEADSAAVEILTDLVQNFQIYNLNFSTASELAELIGVLWKVDLELAETIYIEAALLGCPDEAINYIGERLIEGHYSIDSYNWTQATKEFHAAWSEGKVALYAFLEDKISPMSDPADDLYRDDGYPTSGPDWQDITEVEVIWQETDARIGLTVNSEFPSMDTFWDGAIMILIDIDGDGEVIPSEGIIDFYEGNFDYGIFISSPEFGEPPIFIVDLNNPEEYDTEGATFSIDGDKIEIQVELNHIGTPDGVMGYVAAIRTGYSTELVEDRVPNEELAYQWPAIHVAILGDLNADSTVNILDLAIVAIAFGSKPDDPNWNQTADMNNDEVINILDLAIIALEYGSTA